MTQRAKGQEVRVVLVAPTGTVNALGEGGVASIEFEFMQEILSEAYLGETTERKDDIFKGTRGNLEAHLANQDYFRFVDAVIARSQRRTPADATFNIFASIQLANGQRPRVLLEDIFFGALPINVGARDEYVTVSIDFECAQGRFLYA